MCHGYKIGCINVFVGALLHVTFSKCLQLRKHKISMKIGNPILTGILQLHITVYALFSLTPLVVC